ncbi:MAG: hypothetical protein K6T88_22030 [Bacillus sp. (in: Bacteria)]|nr:hypothetical protein [Bacillus sp. (in: firmicutes)]
MKKLYVPFFIIFILFGCSNEAKEATVEQTITESLSLEEQITNIMSDENASDTKVKEIKVLGESAKSVTYVEYFMDDFSKQYMYWIAYTGEEPTDEDFDIIMQ